MMEVTVAADWQVPRSQVTAVQRGQHVDLQATSRLDLKHKSSSVGTEGASVFLNRPRFGQTWPAPHPQIDCSRQQAREGPLVRTDITAQLRRAPGQAPGWGDRQCSVLSVKQDCSLLGGLPPMLAMDARSECSWNPLVRADLPDSGPAQKHTAQV